MTGKLSDFIRHRKEDFQDYLGGGVVARIAGVVVGVYFFAALALGWYWSSEPELFDVNELAEQKAQEMNRDLVTGFTTTETLITLEKN